MENSRILELLEKYKSGTCTEADLELLENWYQNLDDGKGLELIEDGSPAAISLADEMWPEFKTKLSQMQEPVVKRLIWPRFAAAAVLLISLSATLYFYIHKNNSIVSTAHLTTEIKPGDHKAVLTLADGSNIELDGAVNGKLAEQSGTKILKLADGQLSYARKEGEVGGKNLLYNTISTPNGGQYMVVLPDGTRVWLNAASSLRYPISFKGKERNVTLTGEGYFEVAKNADMPFKVKTASQEVTVLGTHFNINSYTDEPFVRTTLLEGSVKVSQPNFSVLIKPGQQLQTTTDQKNKVVEADTREAIAWKDGLFSFKRADIQTVMRQVARWYNVEVEYRGKLPDSKFTGKIYRNVSISQVLTSIGYLGLDFKIEGRKIIITTET